MNERYQELEDKISLKEYKDSGRLYNYVIRYTINDKEGVALVCALDEVDAEGILIHDSMNNISDIKVKSIKPVHKITRGILYETSL